MFHLVYNHVNSRTLTQEKPFRFTLFKETCKQSCLTRDVWRTPGAACTYTVPPSVSADCHTTSIIYWTLSQVFHPISSSQTDIYVEQCVLPLLQAAGNPSSVVVDLRFACCIQMEAIFHSPGPLSELGFRKVTNPTQKYMIIQK